jgi:hypothetical protein
MESHILSLTVKESQDKSSGVFSYYPEKNAALCIEKVLHDAGCRVIMI